MEIKKKKKGGRSKKNDSESRKVYIPFRLTEEEAIEFDRLMVNSGAKTKTEFIKASIFKTPIRSIQIDKGTFEYYKLLNNLQAQYKKIGVNYNQVTKAIHTAFEEKKALALLYKLQGLTYDLVKLNIEIKALTKKVEE